MGKWKVLTGDVALLATLGMAGPALAAARLEPITGPALPLHDGAEGDRCRHGDAGTTLIIALSVVLALAPAAAALIFTDYRLPDLSEPGHKNTTYVGRRCRFSHQRSDFNRGALAACHRCLHAEVEPEGMLDRAVQALPWVGQRAEAKGIDLLRRKAEAAAQLVRVALAGGNDDAAAAGMEHPSSVVVSTRTGSF